MRVLITGALGHIGSALIRHPAIVDQATEVVMVDDLSTNRYCSLFNLPRGIRWRFVEGKVCEMVTEDRIGAVDSVIHLAATADASAQESVVTENSLSNTQHVAEYCTRTGAHMIFPSSTSVYSSPASLVDEETLELEPAGSYAKCKVLEESVIAAICPTEAFTVFRLGTIYGTSPGMRFHTAVNRFCWQAIHHQPVQVWETAYDQTRPYLAVQDAANAMAQVATKQRSAMGITNLVSCNMTVGQVLRLIEQFVGDLKIEFVQSPVMNNLSFAASVGKAEDLGFIFNKDMTSAIEKTLRVLGLESDRLG